MNNVVPTTNTKTVKSPPRKPPVVVQKDYGDFIASAFGYEQARSQRQSSFEQTRKNRKRREKRNRKKREKRKEWMGHFAEKEHRAPSKNEVMEGLKITAEAADELLNDFFNSADGRRFVVISDDEEPQNPVSSQYMSTNDGVQSGYPMYSEPQQVNGYNATMTTNGFDDNGFGNVTGNGTVTQNVNGFDNEIDFDVGDQTAFDYIAENQQVEQTLAQQQKEVETLRKQQQEAADNQYARLADLKKPKDGSYVWR